MYKEDEGDPESSFSIDRFLMHYIFTETLRWNICLQYIQLLYIVWLIQDKLLLILYFKSMQCQI